ncbi:MAG TPA: hypothetical protein VK907_02155 [Phnomibacter sp.]|nr:hypothetical protein [Phnomibacter sp.]
MKKKMMLWAMLPTLFAALTFTSCQKSMDVTRDGDVSTLKKEATYDALLLDCNGAGENWIDLKVTAGLSGAPAGFSVQWMTKADFDANGGEWPMQREIYNDLEEIVGYTYCEASFSGVPKDSPYSLGPDEFYTVTIGMGGTTCDGMLDCETDYVFRAFAHANNRNFRSAYTIFDGCSTTACPE